MALEYVSDNDILNFFITAGVNMDLFYRLLWRHVFAVEIIKEHYHIVDEEARDSFLSKIRDRFGRNKARQQAISYLKEWGESFWKDSYYRVKEVTKTLERNLEASLGGTLEAAIPGATNVGAKLNAGAARKLSEEQKAEVVQRGQTVVDKVQMKVLSDIIDLLEGDLLDDRQKKYYITVDRLDEKWVNDDLRYRLVRALLDTVRDFNHRLHNVKIIVAIREDLLDRVFRYTRSPGYQEEKYKSMYLPITWKEDELEELLDRRVDQLVREQYTTKTVKLRDLLPSTVNKQDPVKYLLERTMLRPRDVIMFFNECIKAAEGRAKITQTMIYQAEAVYSENRLRALADEWAADYPNLFELGLFLKKFPKQFCPEDMKDRIEMSMLDFLTSKPKEDVIFSIMREKFDSGDVVGFMQEMFEILYKAGVVGVKHESYSGVHWSYLGHKLSGSEINHGAMIHIHPAFWRVLGVYE